MAGDWNFQTSEIEEIRLEHKRAKFLYDFVLRLMACAPDSVSDKKMSRLLSDAEEYEQKLSVVDVWEIRNRIERVVEKGAELITPSYKKKLKEMN